ncbi:MAG: MFS transporter [Acidimicrobiia bacterium]|nr:MFS transporter [Acidimicrobiia bacterium]
MRRRVLVRLDAPPERVRETATRVLGLRDEGDGVLVGEIAHRTGDATARLAVDVRATGTRGGEPDGTTVELTATSDLRVPFFGWLVDPLVRLGTRQALRQVVAAIEAELAGEAAPTPRHHALLPPVPFTAEQAKRLAALAAVAALASFSGALLTQNGDTVARSFHQSDEALGFALALARAGVLFALVASAVADRVGRRRLILLGLVVAALANGLAAAAPSFEVFTASQVLTRAALNATAIVASVAAVEEAPEGARAYALSLFALALGLGFSLSVVLLPLSDLGSESWRIAFAASAMTVFLVPLIARHLRETDRFVQLASRVKERWRIREVFDARYGKRFVVLGLVAFLTSIFAAPSSQLTNRYLTGAHDFSNSQVAIFRMITAGVPGILGLLLAGRLAESRGRRPVAILGLFVATAAQAAFFLGAGALLWLAPPVAIMAAACAGLAVGTVNTELFPTEVRGTSNGFILVCGVAGAALGLVLTTQLRDAVGGLGPAIALCGIAPILAAVVLLRHLPETRARTLDEVSPSEI